MSFSGHNTNTSNTTETALKLIRKSLKSTSMDRMEGTHFDGTFPHIFTTFGASVIILNFIATFDNILLNAKVTYFFNLIKRVIWPKKKSIQHYGGYFEITYCQLEPSFMVMLEAS